MLAIFIGGAAAIIDEDFNRNLYPITQVTADARTASVLSVEYETTLNLVETNQEMYTGTVVLKTTLDLDAIDDFLVVDAQVREIEAVNVNGTPVLDFEFSEYQVRIPKASLLASSDITITFGTIYDNDSKGLAYYHDTIDGGNYLHS